MPFTRTTTTLLAMTFLSTFIQGSGLEPSSALQLNEKKGLPPQMVDYSNYDDVIELECSERPGYIRFSGTQLQSVVKVRVTCRCETRRDRSAPEVKYKDLWYQHEQVLGSKQFAPLPIKQKHEIGIFLKASKSSLSDHEIAALATTLVRLRLEASLNRNLLSTVRVPNQAFAKLKTELEKQNFVSYAQNSTSLQTMIPIPLETEFGVRDTLCFKAP